MYETRCATRCKTSADYEYVLMAAVWQKHAITVQMTPTRSMNPAIQLFVVDWAAKPACATCLVTQVHSYLTLSATPEYRLREHTAHLPASAHQEPVQGVRGRGHLPAPAPEEPMQGVRGGGALSAPAPEERVQGVRGGGHLPAPTPKQRVQGVRGGG